MESQEWFLLCECSCKNLLGFLPAHMEQERCLCHSTSQKWGSQEEERLGSWRARIFPLVFFSNVLLNRSSDSYIFFMGKDFCIRTAGLSQRLGLCVGLLRVHLMGYSWKSHSLQQWHHLLSSFLCNNLQNQWALLFPEFSFPTPWEGKRVSPLPLPFPQVVNVLFSLDIIAQYNFDQGPLTPQVWKTTEFKIFECWFYVTHIFFPSSYISPGYL